MWRRQVNPARDVERLVGFLCRCSSTRPSGSGNLGARRYRAADSEEDEILGFRPPRGWLESYVHEIEAKNSALA